MKSCSTKTLEFHKADRLLWPTVHTIWSKNVTLFILFLFLLRLTNFYNIWPELICNPKIVDLPAGLTYIRTAATGPRGNKSTACIL